MGTSNKDMNQRARLLREAGYLPTSGRGEGWIDLEFKHLSLLLIAAATVDLFPQVKCVETIKKISDMCRGSDGVIVPFPKHPEEKYVIAKKGKFSEAIRYLFECAFQEKQGEVSLLITDWIEKVIIKKVRGIFCASLLVKSGRKNESNQEFFYGVNPLPDVYETVITLDVSIIHRVVEIL